MKVYYGKMEVLDDVKQCQCKASLKYYGGMEAGDYAFIRVKNEEPSPHVHRLWKLDRIDDEDGTYVAHFKSEFEFNKLPTTDFITLTIFKITTNLVIFTKKQYAEVGFFELTLVDQNDFKNKIQNATSFNAYISNPDSFRKIEKANSNNDVPNNTKDVYIVKNNERYELSSKGNSFYGNDFIHEFDSNRFDQMTEYISKVKDERKKSTQRIAYSYLVGTSERKPTIENIWDLFCSNVELKATEPATHENEDIDEDEEYEENNIIDSIEFVDKNQIYYGIPGCGKSFRVNEKLKEYGYNSNNIIRTTFYLDYSYTDFIGQLLPMYKGDKIIYKIVPGPFTKALAKAFSNNKPNVALVIEEINRGNAPAIFGDIFQLLDRKDGYSEYEIDNELIKQYFEQEEIPFEKNKKIYIPRNMHIIATMNTSDQNIFKLDAAFKRRWKMIRITNEDYKKQMKDSNLDFDVPGLENVKWTDFVDKINNAIIKKGGLEEDRQIGYWFYQLRNDGNKKEDFANKVLEYLWNDVLKYSDKDIIFDSNIGNFDELIDIYTQSKNGNIVFNKELGI